MDPSEVKTQRKASKLFGIKAADFGSSDPEGTEPCDLSTVSRKGTVVLLRCFDPKSGKHGYIRSVEKKAKFCLEFRARSPPDPRDTNFLFQVRKRRKEGHRAAFRSLRTGYYLSRSHFGTHLQAALRADEHELVDFSSALWTLSRNGGKDPRPFYVGGSQVQKGTADGSIVHKLHCGKTDHPLNFSPLLVPGLSSKDNLLFQFEKVATKGDTGEILRYMKRYKLAADHVFPSGKPLLHVVAGAEGDLSEAVLTLIERGADVNLADELGNTVLHCAAIMGNYTCFLVLLPVCDAMRQNKFKRTVLHELCLHVEPSKLPGLCDLLRKMSILYPMLMAIPDESFCSPMHYACYHPFHLDFMEALLSFRRLSMNQKNLEGRTALQVAFDDGERELFLYLVRKGIIPSAKLKRAAVERYGASLLQNIFLEQALKTNKRRLDLNHLGFKTFPESLSALLAGLMEMSFKNNRLSNFPEDVLLRTPNLRTLNLSFNRLRACPAGLKSLRKLTHLDVSHNALTELSRDICCLTSLKILNFNNNSISELPEYFWLGLAELQELSGKKNKLTSLGRMRYVSPYAKLLVVDVRENQLPFIPRGMLRMPAVRYLNVKGNPFLKEIPAEVLNKPETVISYLRGIPVIRKNRTQPFDMLHLFSEGMSASAGETTNVDEKQRKVVDLLRSRLNRDLDGVRRTKWSESSASLTPQITRHSTFNPRQDLTISMDGCLFTMDELDKDAETPLSPTASTPGPAIPNSRASSALKIDTSPAKENPSSGLSHSARMKLAGVDDVQGVTERNGGARTAAWKTMQHSTTIPFTTANLDKMQDNISAYYTQQSSVDADTMGSGVTLLELVRKGAELREEEEERILAVATSSRESTAMIEGRDYVRLMDIGVSLAYSKYLANSPHLMYAGEDAEGAPLVVVVSQVPDEDEGSFYPVLIRDTHHDTFTHLRLSKCTSQLALPRTVNKGIKKLLPPDLFTLRPIPALSLVDDFVELEFKLSLACYKIGILHCPESAVTEDDLYSSKGSADFYNFLTCIGEVIRLKGWGNYAGGLDVKNGSTGNTSLYARLADYELMFHVSTLLPFHEGDHQRLERKRHLGNDITIIVFIEGDREFDPTILHSQFVQVLVLVRLVEVRKKDHYVVSIICKSGVGQCIENPILNQAQIPGASFRVNMLALLINIERCVLSSVSSFYNLLHKSRRVMLDNFLATATKPPVKGNRKMSTAITEWDSRKTTGQDKFRAVPTVFGGLAGVDKGFQGQSSGTVSYVDTDRSNRREPKEEDSSFRVSGLETRQGGSLRRRTRSVGHAGNKISARSIFRKTKK